MEGSPPAQEPEASLLHSCLESQGVEGFLKETSENHGVEISHLDNYLKVFLSSGDVFCFKLPSHIEKKQKNKTSEANHGVFFSLVSFLVTVSKTFFFLNLLTSHVTSCGERETNMADKGVKNFS